MADLLRGIPEMENRSEAPTATGVAQLNVAGNPNAGPPSSGLELQVRRPLESLPLNASDRLQLEDLKKKLAKSEEMNFKLLQHAKTFNTFVGHKLLENPAQNFTKAEVTRAIGKAIGHIMTCREEYHSLFPSIDIIKDVVVNNVFDHIPPDSPLQEELVKYINTPAITSKIKQLVWNRRFKVGDAAVSCFLLNGAVGDSSSPAYEANLARLATGNAWREKGTDPLAAPELLSALHGCVYGVAAGKTRTSKPAVTFDQLCYTLRRLEALVLKKPIKTGRVNDDSQLQQELRDIAEAVESWLEEDRVHAIDIVHIGEDEEDVAPRDDSAADMNEEEAHPGTPWGTAWGDEDHEPSEPRVEQL
ncbi:hypothetical protein KFL_003470120 [Klebsormidium nitens]|uniref:Uncharacterized protein n=1 Tax=Klebsormidium nitens TaxID=105231 RepID=A0A1Y1I8P4_KLENI|nr:hypothetical protein KFL_003470120 [Klebsormidium nitens]|eukprot:GAQ87355.1 hypothetical protein KFL_003470120 [Klebsormidium nitens]